jgi:hypothetical protein
MGRLIAWLLSQVLFWAALGVVLGPLLFVRGFRLLQRKRLIEDTPRSTVRGAALGPVELSGKAMGPYTLVAPLSQEDCLYYRVAVESNSKRDLKTNKMRELAAPLFLDDGTGVVMIYPLKCELQLPPSEISGQNGNTVMEGMIVEPGEFVREYCIRPGDELFVMGTLQENPWAKPDLNREGSPLSRIGPGFVSEDEAELLRHEAFPTLDPTLPSGTDTTDPDDFDLHPAVILMKGRGPFVISTESQREIVSNLTWKSFLYIWGGPAAAVWGLWQILSQARAAGWLTANF